jgi:mono/diheme cytochrome c family protein
MLKKILKWTGIVLGSLLGLILLFFIAVYFKTESRANKVYEVKVQQLVIPTDSASYALGAHVAAIRGCMDCHVKGGVPFFDEKNPLALLYTANLTSGKGGINYTDKDWIRALRHGIGKDGKSLWFMPVQHSSAALSNHELAALIGYLKKMEPVDAEHPKKKMKPLGRLLTFLGIFPMFPAEEVNHNATFPDEVKPEATAAYGKYLVVGCQGCHGKNYKGGPSNAPGEPPIPDLTTTGDLGKWNSDQFITALHTGKTPDGRTLSGFMPWSTIGKAHTEEELKAIYLYLHELK